MLPEPAGRGRAFSRPRLQFFTIRTDPKPADDFFFLTLSNHFFLILSLPPAQTRRALQMQ